jgi:hypothetical protein
LLAILSLPGLKPFGILNRIKYNNGVRITYSLKKELTNYAFLIQIIAKKKNMKSFYLRLLLLLVLSISMVKPALSANKKLNIEFYRCLSQALDDADLIITLVKSQAHMDAHISFNGNEGSKGVIKIKNAKGELMKQFEIDLVHAPNFSVFNLDEYALGTYTFELITSNGIHVSHLIID